MLDDIVDKKQLLIHAIVGKGITSKVDIDKAVKNKFVLFCGNNWNEDFKWNVDELEKYSIDDLIDLYNKI